MQAAQKKQKKLAALPALDYFPKYPAEALPEETLHGYKKKRKYDASLRPSTADRSTILNILVNISPPNVASNPLGEVPGCHHQCG